MAIKICAKCNEDNKENAAACIKCNTPLDGAQLIGTLDSEKNFAVSTNGSSDICRKCNERVEPGALKCRYCGTVLKAAPRPFGVYRGSSDNTNLAGIVLLFVAAILIPLVGLIVGGIYVLHDDPDKQSIGKGLLVVGLLMLLITFIAATVFV